MWMKWEKHAIKYIEAICPSNVLTFKKLSDVGYIIIYYLAKCFFFFFNEIKIKGNQGHFNIFVAVIPVASL